MRPSLTKPADREALSNWRGTQDKAPQQIYTVESYGICKREYICTEKELHTRYNICIDYRPKNRGKTIIALCGLSQTHFGQVLSQASWERFRCNGKYLGFTVETTDWIHKAKRIEMFSVNLHSKPLICLSLIARREEGWSAYKWILIQRWVFRACNWYFQRLKAISSIRLSPGQHPRHDDLCIQSTLVSACHSDVKRCDTHTRRNSPQVTFPVWKK